MTVYAIHFCPCGFQTDVFEDSDPKRLSCPDCKRELYQARSVEKDRLFELIVSPFMAEFAKPSK